MSIKEIEVAEKQLKWVAVQLEKNVNCEFLKGYKSCAETIISEMKRDNDIELEAMEKELEEKGIELEGVCQ
jgi:hypothetical protein